MVLIAAGGWYIEDSFDYYELTHVEYVSVDSDFMCRGVMEELPEAVSALPPGAALRGIRNYRMEMSLNTY